MKTLEPIVTSLEVSKKLDKALRGAGIEVEPLFWWTRIDGADNRSYISNNYHNGKFFGAKCFQYPALTATEIGAILGTKANYWSNLRKAYCEVMDLTEDIIVPEQMMINAMEQPDIGGEMLCYLIENGLLNNN